METPPGAAAAEPEAAAPGGEGQAPPTPANGAPAAPPDGAPYLGDAPDAASLALDPLWAHHDPHTGAPDLDTLMKAMRSSASEAERALVADAYHFAQEAHAPQVRKSGEPYFTHPFRVALTLAELNADGATVAAGLLHDVLEDCDVPREAFQTRFGEEVLKIVDGVTKLGKLSFSSREERQAENFRKMFLAMAQDIRVIVVKLADRQHNMWTLEHMSATKQQEIAKETLEIFAPLAHRLGIGKIKWELEDTSLRYLHPAEYSQIAQFVADKRVERERQIGEIIEQLQEELARAGVKAEVSGRPKSFYSIYQKMQKQQKEFHELYDIMAVRVIVKDDDGDPMLAETRCYMVLGIVHNLWKPIPGRFKDYIAMPKPNLYRSLHTAVIGPAGRPVEVQIRTQEMHDVAENGIAAHWRYKARPAGQDAAPASAGDLRFTWLRQLLEWQQDLRDATEFMNTVKDDLFADEVFVFTPRGDVIDLPRGATPVDFAYRIHTDVGHHCVGAKINNKIVPLDTKLRNGDRIDVITRKDGKPRLDWMNFVVTNQARNRIRQWLKKEKRDENMARGKQLLESEFGKANIEQLLKSNRFAEIAQKLQYPSAEDLLAAIGYGEVTIQAMVSRLKNDMLQQQERQKAINTQTAAEAAATAVPKAPATPRPARAPGEILVDGVGGLLVSLAKCCLPIPGDPIMGIVTRGRGITIHHSECPNALQSSPERRTIVTWGDKVKTAYPVDIEIETLDRVGLLKDILTKVSDVKANIRAANVETSKHKFARIRLTVDVNDLEHLQRILGAINRISDVFRATRVFRK